MSWLIGVDVGGTFTDFYALDTATGDARLFKRPSTPGNPAEAIVRGLAELRAEYDIPAKAIRRVAHGTTVATNALIQRRGGRVALVTTEGFRDLLEIGRQTRPHMFDLQRDHPAPLVPREHRLEIPERVGADGSVIRPLTDEDVDRLVERVGELGAESCAVCLLFSFLNGEHERAIASRLHEKLPDLFVSVSSEVQPEFREYERFSTTVLNAYLQPVMARYLEYLETSLARDLGEVPVRIYQSSGGLMSVARASRFPVRTALSGPAAGAMGALHTARAAKRPRIITLDVGGTSADVALMENYRAGINLDREVAGFPVRLPMVDIHTIGAGGGSIAWFDRDGLLKVGPQSAGAEPGPACYLRGGTEPTVTDANLLLGRLSPGGLIGGRMQLDEDASRQAFTPLAERLGYRAEKAALGVLGIVVANMVRAIRAVSVEKGHDPADYALMAFGGAGPLHAVAVAQELGMREVMIPAAPGILCAEGLIRSDMQEDFVRSGRFPLDTGGHADIAQMLGELAAEAREWFSSEGVEKESRYLQVTLEARYEGQNFELPVILPQSSGDSPPPLPDSEELRREFLSVHEQHYGFSNELDPVEVINLRLTAGARLSHPEGTPPAGNAARPPEPRGHRMVWFDERAPVDTPVYERRDLAPGHEIEGPAVIEQLDSTTVVPPGHLVSVDPSLALFIHSGNAPRTAATRPDDRFAGATS